MGLKNKEGSGITRERRVACAASSRFGVRARAAPDCQGTERNTAAAPLERCTQLLLMPTIQIYQHSFWVEKRKVKESLSMYENAFSLFAPFLLLCVPTMGYWFWCMSSWSCSGGALGCKVGVRSGVGFLPSSTRVYLTEYLVNWSLEEMVSLCSGGNTRYSYVSNSQDLFSKKNYLGSICKIFCSTSRELALCCIIWRSKWPDSDSNGFFLKITVLFFITSFVTHRGTMWST